ncbi:MAG: hypothetical protein WB783_09025 [Arenicellales bacterium]
MSINASINGDYELADRIRDECIKSALSAYENAAISGLCAEGAFEAAISAIQMLDVGAIVAERKSKEVDSEV